MKTQIACQKKRVGDIANPDLRVFLPTPEDQEKLKEYYDNIILDIDIIGEIIARNLRQIRLYWVCCGKVSDNTRFKKKEDVHEYIKLKLGYVDTFYNHLGQVKYRTKSISFSRMKQKLFDKYMNMAMPLMAEFLGVSEEELLNSQNDI